MIRKIARINVAPFRKLFSKQLAKKSDNKKTFTSLLSDTIGSWLFIGGQACFLSLWIIINASLPFKWDPPPFILLNLMLSFQAAFTGPVLLMASNKQAAIDRERDVDHYLIDVHGNEILEEMSAQIDRLHQLQHEGMDEEHW